MITEDGIAAATIAQIFGSELLRIQNKAHTDNGSVPQMVTMDPKQFLFDERGKQQMSHNQRQNEQRIIQALQREAEAAYPIEQSMEAPPPPPVQPVLHQPIIPQPLPIQQDQIRKISNSPIHPPVDANVWERIATSLEKISASLGHTKISVTKPRKAKLKKTS